MKKKERWKGRKKEREVLFPILWLKNCERGLVVQGGLACSSKNQNRKLILWLADCERWKLSSPPLFSISLSFSLTPIQNVSNFLKLLFKF
jgi:hypothetical protein